ncbi:MAG: ABC transporter ATP-binding protein [Candidatus Eremiobacteraeota bacterium]|nr:ABC transporter ATP-binding protein [Candidatus Eremiobacteraeota bacterium]
MAQVVKTYRACDGPILRIPSLELAARQELGLKGKSGSGKSTLLNLIAGILLPDSGSIEVDGRDMTRLDEAARDGWRGRRIGYVHQSFHLLPSLTVWENLWVAAALSGQGKAERIESFLERLDLQDRRNFKPSRLSLGQQQRVAVARALVHHPILVLADEPTGNLDAEMAQTALELLRSMCRESGAALLLVSHDPAILSQFEHSHDLSELNQACS